MKLTKWQGVKVLVLTLWYKGVAVTKRGDCVEFFTFNNEEEYNKVFNTINDDDRNIVAFECSLYNWKFRKPWEW
jgi:hypothetical protein